MEDIKFMADTIIEAAVRKQQPEKVVYDRRFGYKERCPACSGEIRRGMEYFPAYCSDCGQKLDWSEFKY